MKYRIVEMRDRFYIEVEHGTVRVIGQCLETGPITEDITKWYPVNILGKVYKGEKDYPRLEPKLNYKTALRAIEHFKKGPIIHEV